MRVAQTPRPVWIRRVDPTTVASERGGKDPATGVFESNSPRRVIAAGPRYGGIVGVLGDGRVIADLGRRQQNRGLPRLGNRSRNEFSPVYGYDEFRESRHEESPADRPCPGVHRRTGTRSSARRPEDGWGRRVLTERASTATGDSAGLADAVSHLRPGDVFVVWKLDRLGRTVEGLVELGADLRGQGVRFRSLTDGIDTTTPADRFLFHVTTSLAQMRAGTAGRWHTGRAELGAAAGPGRRS
ncbi:MAG: recombinase family protein [Isosphaeraceae bacterium]